MATVPFDSYQVNFFSRPDDNPVRASITLLANGQRVGALRFWFEGTDVPMNSVRTPPVLDFPESAFDRIIDILRNEKPLFLQFHEGLRIGVISTSEEPVGEEEFG